VLGPDSRWQIQCGRLGGAPHTSPRELSTGGTRRPDAFILRLPFKRVGTPRSTILSCGEGQHLDNDFNLTPSGRLNIVNLRLPDAIQNQGASGGRLSFRKNCTSEMVTQVFLLGLTAG
jgi:hypothetical protein